MLRPGAILSEAVRNGRASRARTILLSLSCALTVSAAAGAEMLEFERIAAQARNRHAAGDALLIASSESGELPAADCVGLERSQNVLRAGTLDRQQPTALAQMPGKLAQPAEATSSLLSIWQRGAATEAPLPRSGWVVGHGLAGSLRLSPNSLVRLGSQTRRVDVVLPADIRYEVASGWVIRVRPPVGTTQECWVEFNDGAAAGASDDWIRTQFGGVEDLVVRPFLDSDLRNQDLALSFRNRVTRHMWLAAATVSALAAGLTVRTRRAEIGLYRACGASRTDLALLGACEYAILTCPTIVVGFGWTAALFLATHAGAGADAVVLGAVTGLKASLVVAFVSPLLWILATRDRVADQLKER